MQETDVLNLDRFFSDDEPEEEDVGKRLGLEQVKKQGKMV